MLGIAAATNSAPAMAMVDLIIPRGLPLCAKASGPGGTTGFLGAGVRLVNDATYVHPEGGRGEAMGRI
jgi:hypothetical protein